MKNPFDNLDDDNGMSGLDSLNNLMNNFHDIMQQPDHHGDSLFSGDDTGHSDWNDSHSLLNDSLHDPGISDMSHSEWNDSHSGIHDNLHDSGVSDMNNSILDDSIPLSQFDNTDSFFQNNGNIFDPDPNQTDYEYTDALTNEPLLDSDLSGTEIQNEDDDLSDISEPDDTDSLHDLGDSKPDYSENQENDIVMEQQLFENPLDTEYIARSSEIIYRDSDSKPYITIDDLGYVYFKGENEVGRIEGHTVYNKFHDNCGYWTTDGKVYDYYDNLVGWVHPNGTVYAKGKDGDLEVHKTGKGAAGGAAYLLLVWCGGQTHI